MRVTSYTASDAAQPVDAGASTVTTACSAVGVAAPEASTRQPAAATVTETRAVRAVPHDAAVVVTSAMPCSASPTRNKPVSITPGRFRRR